MLSHLDRQKAHRAVEHLQRLRAANLRRLRERFPTVLAFSLAIAKSPSMYHHLVGNPETGEPPRRNIGERLARQIEAALHLDLGWLDRKHS